MVGDGSREHGLARPAGAENPQHPTFQFLASQSDIASLLDTWDSDIERAAYRAANKRGLAYDSAQEFTQAARIALARIAQHADELGSFYVRRVIQNAIRDAARRERRMFGTTVPLDADSTVDPTSETQGDREAYIAAWVTLLPDRLHQMYELLYVHGYTQREAARLMGVSQPRVAQLHSELLRRGRAELDQRAA